MTIPDQARQTSYSPVTPTTSFLVGFPIYDGAEVEVWHAGVLMTAGVDYTVSAPLVGGVSTNAAVAVIGTGWTGSVVIAGARPPHSTEGFTDGKGVTGTSFNFAYDVVVASVREIYDRVASLPRRKLGTNFFDFRGVSVTNMGAAAELTGAVNLDQLETYAANLSGGGLAYSAILVSYADTHGLGNTVQAALDTLAGLVTDPTASISALAARVSALEAGAGSGRIPVGTMADFGGTVAPSGWILCFGQSLLRSSFPALFAAIGTAHGFVDGSHFNLPDCRGRVRAGKDNMGGVSASRLSSTGAGNSGINGNALGAAGGVDRYQLTEAQLAQHDHPFAHTVTVAAGGAYSDVPTSTQASFTTGPVNTGNAGSNQAHPNVQPTIVLNTIIYAGV